MRNVAGEVSPWQDHDTFYQRREKIKQIHAEWKSLKGASRKAFYDEHKESIQLNWLADSTYKRMREIREQKERVLSSKLPEAIKKKRVEVLDERLHDAALKFNTKYNSAIKNI